MASKEEKNEVPKDPIVDGSLLMPIVISMVILLISLGWALYDEAYTRRPWKDFQSTWLEIAPAAYDAKMAAARAEYAAVTGSETYQELAAAAKAEADRVAPELQLRQDEINKVLLPRLNVIGDKVKFVRSEVAALTYLVEHSEAAGHPEDKDRHLKDLAAKKAEEHEFHFPGEEKPVVWDYEKMLGEFNRIKERQGVLQGEMARIGAKAAALRKERDSWRDARLTLPKPEAIAALKGALDEFVVEVKQIHIITPEGELVERCESCHLGIRDPAGLTAEDVGGRAVYAGHPGSELLGIHPPDQFGCTPCHNGNGIALTGVDKAHGQYKHWLWPLYAEENIYAGCIQCHTEDLHLDHGGVFNQGRELYRWRGCWGCHRYEGYGAEWEQVGLVAKELSGVENDLADARLELERIDAITNDEEADEETLEAAFAAKPAQQQRIHLLMTQQTKVQARLADLELETKKVGPNLKEVTAKLKPEWLHSWLLNPMDFRPDTKMPEFYINDEQAWDIAAFLWQSGDPVKVPEFEEGDAERGQWLFTVRGCYGCHKMYDEEADDVLGNGFAADLSRVGEKANPAYLASWIQNPRYHNKYTVMPSLRLSDQDARDIATWLSGLAAEDAEYPSRDAAMQVLTDPARKAAGEKLVKHLGCAGCHEIKGLENEGRIGVELTKEGSKPLERLDFGLKTHPWKKEGRYNHKGFFEGKLSNPQVYDEGKYKESYFDSLKMPNFHLGEEDLDALTTFLLGSVESEIPPSMKYAPEGAKKDIQEGWWLIRKYNCDGCHQIMPGVIPELWNMPWYEDGAGFDGVPDGNGRPPTLVGQGSRVNPEWFSKFLANPALTDDPEQWHRNGVRQGLAIRMPSYDLSEHERGVLVRFFRALAEQPTNYGTPDVKRLDPEELTVARAAFVAGDCFNCHLLGGETEIDPNTIYAPSFEPVIERVSPDWIYRWVTEPQSVIPGTAMPALFGQREDGHWVIKVDDISAGAKARLGPALIEKLRNFQGDHADLIRRYFAQFDAGEAEYMKRQRAKN